MHWFNKDLSQRWHLLLSTQYSFHFQKTTQLRKMLESPELEFIMEAHNGLSAKIVQEAGQCHWKWVAQWAMFDFLLK